LATEGDVTKRETPKNTNKILTKRFKFTMAAFQKIALVKRVRPESNQKEQTSKKEN
jgi:hypothetical protein